MSLPFLASTSHMHCLILLTPFLNLHEFITLTSTFLITLSSPSLVLLPSSIKDPCEYIGLTQLIQDYLPHLNIFHLITSEKLLLTYDIRLHIHKFPGLKRGHLWRAYNQC